MQLRLTIVLLCPLVVAGCRGSDTTPKATNTDTVRAEQSSPTPATTPPSAPTPQTTTAAADSPKVKSKLDACAMLTTEEIQSIQGEALKETKLSERSADGFYTSQCFFTLPTFTNSISLAVTQRADSPGARDPRKFWKDNFHRDKERTKERDREREREEEEGEESRPPQKITGIGDEAFWMASPAAGILYVLKGSSYVRISIGGRGDQQTKIKKSKALARKVIDRL